MKNKPLENDQPRELADYFFRHSYGKMVAVLTRYFGLAQIETAEDIVQDALVEAMEKWSICDIPDNPGGWLMDVARKKTINYLKRNQLLRSKVMQEQDQNTLVFQQETEDDSTLRLIFACCHPDLNSEAQITLALKTLCGLSIKEIASALLTSEITINKRLYRSKKKFKSGQISFDSPAIEMLDERVSNVASTLYLLFNEGYLSDQRKSPIRMDLCFEAIRLLKQVISSFPDYSRLKALLALMLFSVARFEARFNDKHGLIILEDQDREKWDHSLIAEGMQNLSESKESNQISKYHMLAGIAAEHCLANNFESTNWKSIHWQYRILEQMNNNVVLQFNRCIAEFFLGKQQEALTEVLTLESNSKLNRSRYYHTVGYFYSKLKNKVSAKKYYQKAISFSQSDTEKALIKKRLSLIS
ncbi:MAG: sigma-70 family RNA polymerase sigma factor [Bacteroidota bacterium]